MSWYNRSLHYEMWDVCQYEAWFVSHMQHSPGCVLHVVLCGALRCCTLCGGGGSHFVALICLRYFRSISLCITSSYAAVHVTSFVVGCVIRWWFAQLNVIFGRLCAQLCFGHKPAITDPSVSQTEHFDWGCHDIDCCKERRTCRRSFANVLYQSWVKASLLALGVMRVWFLEFLLKEHWWIS